MSRNRLLIVAAAVALFVVAAFVVARLGGGGGGNPVNLAITVTGDSISPERPAVRQGDRVTLTVTADRKEEVHLHGYDLKFEVERPGGSVTRTFTADKSGAFPIEIEGGKELGEFTVRP